MLSNKIKVQTIKAVKRRGKNQLLETLKAGREASTEEVLAEQLLNEWDQQRKERE